MKDLVEHGSVQAVKFFEFIADKVQGKAAQIIAGTARISGGPGLKEFQKTVYDMESVPGSPEEQRKLMDFIDHADVEELYYLIEDLERCTITLHRSMPTKAFS